MSDTTEQKRGHPSPMMFVSIGIGTVIALVLISIVSLLTGGTVKNAGTTPVNALVGTKVSDFTLTGLNGGTFSLPWKSGHPTVVMFFASWCGPCQVEVPKIAAYLSTHDQGSVVVVGVDANDQLAAGRGFAKRSKVAFPVGFDSGGTVTSGVFKIQAIPQTVFVNAKGLVTDVHTGQITKVQLVRAIAALGS